MLANLVASIRKVWATAPFATVILGLALLASLFFGVRSVVFLVAHPPLSERAQPVSAWMTPRFIARSWSVPPKVILRALDAPDPPLDGPMSLTEFSEYRGVPIDQIIAEVEAAIAEFRPKGHRNRGKSNIKEGASSD